MRIFWKLATRALVAAAALAWAASVPAQEYPARDITFIVPFNPGGSTDPLSRAFVAQLEKTLPGNINVENRPGGSATIGANLVVRANPDGYTIGLGDSAALAYQPLVNTGLGVQVAGRLPDHHQAG